MTSLAVESVSRSNSKLESSLLSIGRSSQGAVFGTAGKLRQSALLCLEKTGLPSRKDEAFRFSPLDKLSEESVALSVSMAGPVVESVEVGSVLLPLVNGVACPVGALPQGLRIARLGEASALELACLGSLISEQDGWVAANTAGFADGYVIIVNDGVTVDQTLELAFVQSSDGSATVALPRVVLVLGKGSKLSLIERHQSLGAGVSISNCVIEAVVGDGAELRHARWVDLGDNASQLAATAVSVGLGGSYQSWSATSAGRFVRHDLQVRLSGRRATAILDGLYYGRAGQLVDQHVRVWHEQPEGSTKECYRGVVENHGKGVFDGIIYVNKGAMKTDARQENRNLLLGPEAIVNTKPHLEIDADDVACSHGATVGQLDESQLFYLQARGIDEALGRQLLTWAFANEMVERCPFASLKKFAATRLRGELPDSVSEGIAQ